MAWNIWVGYGNIALIIFLTFFFCIWNGAMSSFISPVLYGWTKGRCVCSPICICPHWVVGLGIPFLMGGVLLVSITVVIPYSAATAKLCYEGDNSEGDNPSQEFFVVCDIQKMECFGSSCRRSTATLPEPSSLEVVSRVNEQIHAQPAIVTATIVSAEPEAYPGNGVVLNAVVVKKE